MRKTLLDKAHAATVTRKSKPISPEEMELALAWLQGEVTAAQVTRALKTAQSLAMAKLANALREAYRAGILHIGAR